MDKSYTVIWKDNFFSSPIRLSKWVTWIPLYSFCFNSIFRYNVLILVVTYVLPLVTLTVTYARVGMELWGSRAIGENTPVQYERIRSKRRVSHVTTSCYRMKILDLLLSLNSLFSQILWLKNLLRGKYYRLHSQNTQYISLSVDNWK